MILDRKEVGLVSARDIAFLCGLKWFTWTRVNELGDDAYLQLRPWALKIFDWKRRRNGEKGFWYQQPKYDLGDLIKSFADQKSQGPRDKVFA